MYAVHYFCVAVIKSVLEHRERYKTIILIEKVCGDYRLLYIHSYRIFFQDKVNYLTSRNYTAYM